MGRLERRLAILLGDVSREAAVSGVEFDIQDMAVRACAAIGAVFDSLLVAAGWVEYYSGQFSDVMAPYWIITMWMLFATTLNVSLKWLRGKVKLAMFFGLLGGPLAYLGGEKLGGIDLVNQFAALAALGIGWAVMMPVLLWLSQTFDGMSEPEAIPVPIPVRKGD